MRVLLLLLVLLAAGQPVWGAGDPFPKAAAAYLVRLDGQELWGRQLARRLPPASLTKLMTALLVLERLPPGREIAVSRAAARESGTTLGLKQGERFRVAELLAAALIASANDACRALADAVAEPDQFVALMNRRAREWQLADTHFSNACGHDQADHYSSAADLAKLAERVLAQPALKAVVALPELAIADAAGTNQYHFTNTNLLLGRLAGVSGMKTGFTPKGGKCLVAYGERGGHRVLLVMLNAPNRWWDAEDIINLAFAHVAPPP